jgi:hypothetical protein
MDNNTSAILLKGSSVPVRAAPEIPVAPPDVLGDLTAAFNKVQAGQLQYWPAGEGEVIYQVGEH